MGIDINIKKMPLDNYLSPFKPEEYSQIVTYRK
jgi:hypothetical protein